MEPLNALYKITNGGNFLEENILNHQLLRLIKDSILESSSSKTYKPEQVWRVSGSQEDGYHYVFSTMLGISIPVEGDWEIETIPFSSSSPALFMFTQDSFKVKGKKASVSVVVLAITDSLYKDSIKKDNLAKYPIIKTEIQKIDKIDFEKYTYDNPNAYKDERKGAHGYWYYAKVSPGQYSGARCEHIYDFSEVKSDTDFRRPVFTQIVPAQNRLQKTVHVIIFVDSCNSLAGETDKLLEKIFKRSVFE